MFRQSLLLSAVLCTGIFAGYYLLRGPAPEPGGPNAAVLTDSPKVAHRDKDNPDDTLARLQQRLRQADQERVWLAERVEALEALIGNPGVYPEIEAGTPATETKQATEPATPAQTFRASIDALIEAGIPAEQAARIQARLDEYDLEKLHMQDRASREGWLNTSRYHMEKRQFENGYRELRAEIGDDAYDRMLYALGRANRVVVRDIMQNSTAEQYGLQANDRIIGYDGQRVFTAKELTALVTRGDTGAPVLVQVQRDEQQLDFYLPHGPIGIRLATSRELP